jgi:hypothetical protein
LVSTYFTKLMAARELKSETGLRLTSTTTVT